VYVRSCYHIIRDDFVAKQMSSLHSQPMFPNNLTLIFNGLLKMGTALKYMTCLILIENFQKAWAMAGALLRSYFFVVVPGTATVLPQNSV